MLSDGLIEGKRAPGDVIAPAADDDAADVTGAQGATARSARRGAMIDPTPRTTECEGVGRKEFSLCQSLLDLPDGP